MLFNTAHPMFWYRPLFIVEIVIAELFFTHTLKWRNFHYLRLLIGTLVAIGATFFIPIPAAYSQTPWWSFITFLVLFLFSLAVLCFTFRSRFKEILFAAVAGYTVQHVAQEAYECLNIALGLNGKFSSDFYSDDAFVFDGVFIYRILVYVCVIVIFYALQHAMFASKAHKLYPIKNIWLVGICFAVMFINIIISSVVTYSMPENSASLAVVIVHFYNIVTCILTLTLTFELPRRIWAETELSFSERIYNREKQQYALAKENIELINIKLHDLKHQINESPSERLAQLSEAIEQYDAVIMTGNEALNVILTEKNLYCKQHSISLTCLCDGNLLSFMNSSDVYALFGNLLSNAIEAVEKLSGGDRAVSVRVKSHNALCIISVRNFYAGELEFADGLPVTTKAEKSSHGYGMRSVRLIVSQYGGEMTIKTDDNTFVVNIVFAL